MADFHLAVELALKLAKGLKMGLHEACRIAAGEYNIDPDKLYRVITE